MRLALRGLLVPVAAAVLAQAGAAAPERMHLVTAPFALVLWNGHDGLLGVGRCDAGSDVHAGLCVSGAVERTSDGGRTFHVVLRTGRAVDGLQSLGPDSAIATTIGGRSWRTLDGGRTWRPASRKPLTSWLTPRFGVSFRAYFTHDRQVLALRLTRDGGRTWQRLRDPCESAVASSAAADLVTPSLWWVVCLGGPGAGNEDKAIYNTRDGGRTWQAGAATLSIAAGARQRGGIQEYGYPEGLAFAPDGFGLLTESRGTLYVTRDGGVTWQAKPHVAQPEVDLAGGAAVFPGGIGYVLLTSQFHGRLIETRDHGRTWHVVHRWAG